MSRIDDAIYYLGPEGPVEVKFDMGGIVQGIVREVAYLVDPQRFAWRVCVRRRGKRMVYRVEPRWLKDLQKKQRRTAILRGMLPEGMQ